MTTDQSAEDSRATDSWYLTWLPRIGIGVVLAMLVGYGTQWIFTSTTDFLLTMVMAFFIAFAMLPAVDYLSNRRSWRRGAATGLVMFVGSLIAIVFSIAIAQLLLDQIVQLVDAVPGYALQVTDWVNSTFDQNYTIDDLINELGGYDNLVRSGASTLLSGALGFTSTAVGMFFRALTMGLFVFYILADLPKLRKTLLGHLNPRNQAYVDTFFTTTIQKVGGYVYSRLVLASVSAAFHYIVFLILDLPYALAMALWVGLVSQFVPSVGTYLAGVVPIVIALMEDPMDAVWVLVAVTVYQQIENYAISPKITANTMDLHPAVAFGSAIVGGSLLGAAGALLALPVAATITALVQTYATDYAVIESDMIEDHEAYEARMAAKKEAKAERKAGRKASREDD